MECVLPSQQQTLETHDETVEVAAGCVSLRGKHDQFTVRKIASALRLILILRQTTCTLEKSCSQSHVPEAHQATVEGFWLPARR